MECKFRQVDRAGVTKVRINRYIMECKLKRWKIAKICFAELIDTLWNVNVELSLKSMPKPSRINRYIMECKFLGVLLLVAILCELIDTLWNVNI